MFKMGDEGLRWSGIAACGVALLLCLLLAPGALAQIGVWRRGNPGVRQTASQSLTLIKPSDADFDSTLDAYFPGLSQEDGYEQAMRPFLVIVRNDTTLPVLAYAITWTVNYATRSDKSRQAIVVNRPLMNHGAMRYIPPGFMRLISPVFNVTPKGYLSFDSFGELHPASTFPSLRGLASVDVNVDGVVYSDGSFIGPNQTGVLQRYMMEWFAERDEALAALRLISSSTAGQLTIARQLQQTLNNQFEWYLEAAQGTPLAMYVRARGLASGDLQEILSVKGLSGLEAVLQSFVGRSGANGNPSTFDRMYRTLSESDPRVFGTIPWSPQIP